LVGTVRINKIILSHGTGGLLRLRLEVDSSEPNWNTATEMYVLVDQRFK